MPTLSMNEVSTYRWSLDEDVRRYAEAGYEGIGVWRQKLSDFGEDDGVDLIAESGLLVTNLTWAGGFTGGEYHSPAESIQDAIDAIRLAGALGAGCLVLYPGGRNNHIYRHAERLLRSALDELIEHAADAEVTLALEPMHPACAERWTFITDLESATAVVESYHSPFLKLAFDAYHFAHDRAVLANLPELVPHLGIVHLSDRVTPHSTDQDRRPPGQGRLHLAELVRGLLEAGYTGDFDVEVFGPQMTPNAYDDLLTSSQEFFERVLAPA